MARGFVYILLNPAVPGYVKIGKTTQTPEDRAEELSGATGVPMPFVVAYDAVFADCDRAEEYVHALLQARGVQRTPNREFFALSLREAIAIVMEAEREFGQQPPSVGSTSRPAADSISDHERPVWLETLREAESHHYGWADTLQDQDRAIALYKQAARLGAPEVYVPLAELYAERGDSDEGIRWLTRGAESGAVDCWAELALIYTGENITFDTSPHQENARKAWRRFFRSVDPTEFDEEGSLLYAMLRRYVSLVRAGHPDSEDVNTIHRFVDRFTDVLATLRSEPERQAKLLQLRELLEKVG